ncbi:hypothetical protein HY625_03055 [Candidatus Uhrbacteria bacterium]|nr:hypothetical protein [Candidatus Uhrbacteria bacterium]
MSESEISRHQIRKEEEVASPEQRVRQRIGFVLKKIDSETFDTRYEDQFHRGVGKCLLLDGEKEPETDIEALLKSRDEKKIYNFVRDIVGRCIHEGRPEDGRDLADFLEMKEELQQIDSLWLDAFVKEYEEARTDKEKFTILFRVFAGDTLDPKFIDRKDTIGQDPRFQEMKNVFRFWMIMKRYREYRYEKKLDALDELAKVLKVNSPSLKDDPVFFEGVHRDAIRCIRDLMNAGHRIKAAQKVDTYCDVGILNLEEDSGLIEEVTAKEQDF